MRALGTVFILCALLTGCNSGGDDDPSYSIGGTISGLNGTVVLQNSGGADISISDNGIFSFSTPVTRDSAYLVTVLTQPAGQTCVVLNGSGTVNNTNVIDVTITCTLNSVEDFTLTPMSVKTFRFTWTDVPVPGVTEYRLLEDPDGVSGYTEIASIASGIEHHDLDAFLPGRINARYVLQACNDDNCVDSVPVNVEGTLAEAVGYVKASNTGEFDAFGYSVTLSADGSTMAVGAYMEASATTGINGDETDDSAGAGGAVYVFTRSDSVWSQQAYIKASNAGADDIFGDQFGHSIALSTDGDTLAVGAPFEASNAVGINGEQGDNSTPQSGAVYVFTRNDNTWSQQAYIKASNIGAHWFGWSVTLASSGNTLAVGAWSEGNNVIGINNDQNDGSAPASGAVYVFTRSNDAWNQQAYIKASNTLAGAMFGYSVALAADSNTLAVGAAREASNATGINGAQDNNLADNSGAVYVFIRNNDTWSQQAYIKASNTGTGDLFGYSVAVSTDGDTLAVGAIGEDSDTIGINGDQDNDLVSDSGAVYIFIRSDNTWSQQAYIKASNTGADAMTGADVIYGSNVDLSANGNTLVVSAHGESGFAVGINGDMASDKAVQSGAAYMYVRNDQTWSQQAYIKAPNTLGGNWFGRGLDLAADGNTLAVGAYGEDGAATGINGDQDQSNDWIGDSGAVYLY